MTDAEYIAAYYRPWAWWAFRWGVKLGPLTLYVNSCGIGWTWFCGRGHELRWKKL